MNTKCLLREKQDQIRQEREAKIEEARAENQAAMMAFMKENQDATRAMLDKAMTAATQRPKPDDDCGSSLFGNST